MLTRCNSLVRGHSAVRTEVIERIASLLMYEITPVVPLRGSISASGDLSPLSYIAGVIEGSPDIFVRVGKGTQKTMNAQQALQEFNLPPITLAAKEGLGLLNGTAFSAATASLAMYQAQELAVFSQALTAMGVESLQGSAESFYPQIAAMRPHPGQIESAQNISAFLQGSLLAQGLAGTKDTTSSGLYQDRYALRTASQWIGPQLEDLIQAQEQLRVELNSTTDNPLIDTENDEILHGGNFQAAVVTSTMDRTRLCIEKFGKLLFAQATEIINPATSKGLPANLCADDPSTSYTCKGIDINMAAYTSELGFLANPVGNHVNSAEMHNQALNSLALISARYTLQALDVLYQMTAAYLFVACQALDLRVLQIEFLVAAKQGFQQTWNSTLARWDSGDDVLIHKVWDRINSVWPTTTTLDLKQRCKVTTEATIADIVQHFSAFEPSTIPQPATVTAFTNSLQSTFEQTYNIKRGEIFQSTQTVTPKYLGRVSKAMYNFVRGELGIKLHRGLVEHPTQPAPEWMHDDDAEQRKTIGNQVSIIFEALRDRRASKPLMNVVSGILAK